MTVMFNVLDTLTLAFEIAGLLILTISAIIALSQWLGRGPRSLLSPDESEEKSIRIEFGHRVVLALEFLIGADIIQTVKDPSFEELGRLAVIVLIRTVLHFSLK